MLRKIARQYWGADRGSAAIEFAIIGPLLIVLLLSIMGYGGYFLMAHSVQQLANDGARAAIAGLDQAERRDLVGKAVLGGLAQNSLLSPSNTSWTLNEADQRLAVAVSADASRTPFFALSTLTPMPSPVIRRSAVITLGGY